VPIISCISRSKSRTSVLETPSPVEEKLLRNGDAGSNGYLESNHATTVCYSCVVQILPLNTLRLYPWQRLYVNHVPVGILVQVCCLQTDFHSSLLQKLYINIYFAPQMPLDISSQCIHVAVHPFTGSYSWNYLI